MLCIIIQAEVTADALECVSRFFQLLMVELGGLIVRVKMVANEVDNSTVTIDPCHNWLNLAMRKSIKFLKRLSKLGVCRHLAARSRNAHRVLLRRLHAFARGCERRTA